MIQNRGYFQRPERCRKYPLLFCSKEAKRLSFFCLYVTINRKQDCDILLRKNIINQTPVWKTMFEGQGRNVLENLRVEEAIEQLLMYTKAVQEAETVSLLSANGRILAEDMKAERDNPPFDRAPVDGYACKAEDLAGALPEKQVTLKVIREVDAGEYLTEPCSTGKRYVL